MSAQAPATSPGRTDEFTAVRHVYEPHRVGLPPFGPYLRELWRRREFMFELSRTDVRAQHFNTVFGQLWLVLNPLLLACVFFVLVDILRSKTGGLQFFAHLMAALFVYHFVTDGIRQATKSVTGGGKLILNTAFPRVMLPGASVLTALKRFLPTVLVFIPVYIAAGPNVTVQLLWLIPLFVLFGILTSGIAMLVAAGNVYFRDLKNFLNYALRIWLYGSPVLYYASEVPERYHILLYLNPIAPLLTAWSAVLDHGQAPDGGDLLRGLAWAVAMFVIGGLFFISREREFAVRL